jgi:cell division initiation protein
MKIAPIDIAHKTFARKMMGLDPEEVMDFLRNVSEEMEALIRERNNLRENLREKELAVAEYKERDELLKSTITTAQKMSEKIQVDADREARLILHDAHQKAEMIQRDARDSLKRIYQEITDLKRVRMQFENNMRALVQSHLTMLEQGTKVMPSPSQAIEGSMSLEMQEDDEARMIRDNVTKAVKKAARPVDF